MVEYKSFEDLKKELGDNYDKFMYDMNLELIKQKEETLKYLKKDDVKVIHYNKNIGLELDAKSIVLEKLGEDNYKKC